MPALSDADVDAVRSVFFEKDVFGFHDTGIPREIVERPYQFLDMVRDKHGVVAQAPNGLIEGLDVAQNFMLDRSRPIYTVLDFELVQAVLKNPGTYAQGYDKSFSIVFGRVPPTLNPPEHGPYRALINKAFGRMAIDRLTSDVIVPSAEALVDRIEADGHFDLVPAYTAAMPFLATAKILDLPSSHFAIFAQQVRDLMAIGHNPQAGFGAAMAMTHYFGEVVAQRREQPGEDLISSLATAEMSGQRLAPEDVVSFCKLLTPAGMETTTRTFGNLLTALLTDRRQYEMLVKDPSLVPNAVEEALRWEGPAIMMPKLTTEEAVLGGVTIPQGAYVCAFHGGVNHDPKRWDHPHDFDLTREKKPHSAFSGGPHVCPGNHLARREMEVGLATLLRRLPNLRLDPDKAPPQILGFAMRSTSHLHASIN